MKLVIDPRQSGLSGDMLLATLTDFFDCHEYTNSLLASIVNEAKNLFDITCSYKVEKTTIQHFEGSKLFFNVEKDFPHYSVQEFLQACEKILNKLNFSGLAKLKFSLVLERIILVEKLVHGQTNKSLEDIHFHELNSIDTIVDIGVTICILEQQGFPKICGLPTAIGSGTITFSHGTFQQPAPAVAKLLEQNAYPFISRDLDFELTTPTGLTLLTNIVEPKEIFTNLPAGRILKAGIGLGQKQQKNYINYL